MEHVKERLVAPLLFFQLFLYDGFIPQHFRLPYPCRTEAEDCRCFPERPLRVIENGVEDLLRIVCICPSHST